MIRAVFLLFMLLSFASHVAAQEAVDENHIKPVGESFRVHGRLSLYNGTPSCRIWIVGTNRILGVHEVEEKPLAPSGLIQILQEDINDRAIYADFTVSPLRKHEKGEMQIVKIESAENVVITNSHMQYLRRLTEVK